MQRRSRGGDRRWLVFLNNDTLPQSGCLDVLIRYASSGERIGLVGAKLLFPNGTIQHAGVVFARDLTPHHIYQRIPRGPSRGQQVSRVSGRHGRLRLDPASALRRGGGFDARFVNGYEDVDLCLRLRRLGYEIHYCHESVLYHLEPATRDYALDPQNHQLFRERWLDFVHQDDFRYYLEDGLIDITYWEQSRRCSGSRRIWPCSTASARMPVRPCSVVARDRSTTH